MIKGVFRKKCAVFHLKSRQTQNLDPPGLMVMTAMTTTLDTLADAVRARLGGDLSNASIAYGELNLVVRADRIVSVLTALRDDPEWKFLQLIDLCAADYPERARRFNVVYHLLSLRKNARLRIKVEVGEEETLPSVIGVYPNAAWYEREAFDMYGVVFVGNPDMRRLLTDYNFEGHPLRKDFPLTGNVEVRYDDQQKRVVYEPVSLVQDYRNFDYLSPWEGAKYVLPGDEKAKP